MGIDIILAKRKWLLWRKELVIWDTGGAHIHKMVLNQGRRPLPPILKALDPNYPVTFTQDELPLLLDGLKSCLDKIVSEEVEIAEMLIEVEPELGLAAQLDQENISPFLVKEDFRGKLHIITTKESDTIARIIKVVEDNIGKPQTRIIFMGYLEN